MWRSLSIVTAKRPRGNRRLRTDKLAAIAACDKIVQ